MASADMSPRAVTARLLRTAQLRRLCLLLGRRGTGRDGTPPRPGPASPGAGGGAAAKGRAGDPPRGER